MMRQRNFAVAVVVSLLVAAGLAIPVHAQTSTAQTTKITRTGHVYLFRGFMNVFSTGMNDLTNELRRNGIKADVYNHAGYEAVARKAINEYRAGRGREPVFIVGHSLGADAAIAMAGLLEQAKVPVALLVTYDPYAPPVVPSNVRQLINYNQYSNQKSPGAVLKQAEGFRGEVANIDVATDLPQAVDHFNIDKQKSLHETTMKAIFAKSRRK